MTIASDAEDAFGACSVVPVKTLEEAGLYDIQQTQDAHTPLTCEMLMRLF